MSPVARRAVAPAVAPATSGINFGELEFYSGGFNLPEGDYALFFDVRMHAGTKNDGTQAGPERLGVMIAAYPIDPKGNKLGDDANEKFLSMGSKAHLTYAPNPDTGKGLVLVPGGPGQQPNNQTNWSLFLKSLYDCAMPKGVFTNDLTTIDGVWVHTQNVPEPEERKGYGESTGEVQAQPQRKGPSLIPIITSILDGGKPWEGGGGLSDSASAPKAAVAKVAPVRPGPRVAPAAALAAPPAEESGVDEDAVKSAALDAFGEILGATPAGVPKLVLRTKTFAHVKEKEGEDMAKAISDTVFGSDTSLNALLADVGYSVQGAQVKPLG